jgi:hypothetical protein
MNITLLSARQWSLALLLVGLLGSGHLLADYAGTAPQSSGLLRLGRDLMRRTSGSEGAEGAAPIITLAVHHSPPSLTSRSSTTFFTPGIFLTRRFMAVTSQ